MSFTLGMFIEIIVAILLVLTIAYCIVLNKRLTRLRADEEVLRATIAELITATEIAERAILGLKATAAECEKTLGSRLAAAEERSAELDRKIAAADDVIRRTGALGGRPDGQAPVASAPAPFSRPPVHPQSYGFPAAPADAGYAQLAPAELAPPAPYAGYAASHAQSHQAQSHQAQSHQPQPHHAQLHHGQSHQPQPHQAQPHQAAHPHQAALPQPAFAPVPPQAGYAQAPAPQAPVRESAARSLQAAVEAAAERMTALRRGHREEAA